MNIRLLHIAASLALPLMLTSCFFTGVESTRVISDKEVNRTLSEMEQRQPSATITPYLDSLQNWRTGKLFFVTDDQAKMLFDAGAGLDTDTMHLAGKTLRYDGYDIVTSIAGEKTVAIKFDYNGNRLVYRTGKTLDDLTHKFSIPLIIDMDMVNHVGKQLVEKTVYITTPLWYDPSTLQLARGYQFVPVTISAVEPGNKSLPLKVVFHDQTHGRHAFVWMSAPESVMRGRDFDSMFSLKNPHDNYPTIGDSHWALIIKGDVIEGMTKEECRLAKGAPKQITPVPDQGGMREYWYYDGGSYLYFVDGLLQPSNR